MPFLREQLTPRQLPQRTRDYLYQLVVDGIQGAPNEQLQENPDGHPGATIKFGSEPGLAPGRDSVGRMVGGRRLQPPGKYRLVRHIHTRGGKVVWLYAEHMGGISNQYNYRKINLPTCPTCDGYTKVDCDRCGGTTKRNLHERITANEVHKLVDLRKCTKCRGEGLMACPSCASTPGVNPRMMNDPEGSYSLSTAHGRWDTY